MFAIINVSVFIILLLAFFELICIKFHIVLPILNEQIGSSIENICYSLIAACIFYIFIEMIPSLRKKIYYGKILNNKKS
ncbi:MAG: hypothetical protein LBS57_12730, partial [Treponema sp.]|nr:hypothetical protein [Treponema sp.]